MKSPNLYLKLTEILKKKKTELIRSNLKFQLENLCNSLKKDAFHSGLETIETPEEILAPYKPLVCGQRKSQLSPNMNQSIFNQKDKFRSSNIRFGYLSCRYFSKKADRKNHPENEKALADPKSDLAFKLLFGKEQNKDLLIDFLNSVLPEKKIDDVNFLSTTFEPEFSNDKKMIVDVLCRTSEGTKFIVEMQKIKQVNFSERCLYYGSRVYSYQLNDGDDYSKLKEVILITITDFEVLPDGEDYISRYEILDVNNPDRKLKGLSFIFIQLPKYQKKKVQNEIDKWCHFFKNKALDKEPLNQSQVLKKARQILVMSKWSPEERESYNKELEFYTIIKNSLGNYQKDGIKIGEEKGLRKGIIKGKKQGKDEEKLNTAKKMLKMNYPIESIIEITGLSEDKINKIK